MQIARAIETVQVLRHDDRLRRVTRVNSDVRLSELVMNSHSFAKSANEWGTHRQIESGFLAALGMTSRKMKGGAYDPAANPPRWATVMRRYL